MSELDKLEKYLRENGYNVERIDEDEQKYSIYDRHQVIVFDKEGNRKWDAICNRGSYGYEKGLLEVYGETVVFPEDGDSVVGWLTAEEVIARLKRRESEEERQKAARHYAGETGKREARSWQKGR